VACHDRASLDQVDPVEFVEIGEGARQPFRAFGEL
jgi:hypothetical protein